MLLIKSKKINMQSYKRKKLTTEKLHFLQKKFLDVGIITRNNITTHTGIYFFF